MSKIYRRPTLPKAGSKAKTKKNEKNRVRSVIMNFRVSPYEKKIIDARISATGLSRADFFIESCMYQKILVKGNIRSFSEIKNRLEDISSCIEDNPNLEELDDERAECLRIILEIMEKLFGKGK
ncbi:MAG: hypothetical protein K6G84_11675 [Lachnospiraceae bacterium]|nr:hypothetical protein [Lachnospiraceae bacterium]